MDTETSAELKELDKDFVKLDRLIGPKPKRKSAKKKVAKKAKKVSKPKARARKTSLGKRLVKAAKEGRKIVKTQGRRPDISGLSRIDLRLTKKQKTKLAKKAKAQMRTVTSVMLELIDKMK